MSEASERKSPRQMLALIALATDLPMPKNIDFNGDAGRLTLHFDPIRYGMEWLSYLGHTESPHEPLSFDEGKTRATSTMARKRWHGWHVHIFMEEPMGLADSLPEEDRAALNELTEGPHPF